MVRLADLNNWRKNHWISFAVWNILLFLSLILTRTLLIVFCDFHKLHNIVMPLINPTLESRRAYYITPVHISDVDQNVSFPSRNEVPSIKPLVYVLMVAHPILIFLVNFGILYFVMRKTYGYLWSRQYFDFSHDFKFVKLLGKGAFGFVCEVLWSKRAEYLLTGDWNFEMKCCQLTLPRENVKKLSRSYNLKKTEKRLNYALKIVLPTKPTAKTSASAHNQDLETCKLLNGNEGTVMGHLQSKNCPNLVQLIVNKAIKFNKKGTKRDKFDRIITIALGTYTFISSIVFIVCGLLAIDMFVIFVIFNCHNPILMPN